MIVKDLSRLGREYSYMGRLQDFIFPAYDVRFIADVYKRQTLIRASRTTVMMSLTFSLLGFAVLMVKTPF